MQSMMIDDLVYSRLTEDGMRDFMSIALSREDFHMLLAHCIRAKPGC